MIRFQQWLGRLMNAIGAPGFIRDTDYRSRTFGTRVRIRCGNLFTVISVNGIDVYVCRFTGTIHGIGFSPTCGCITASAREAFPAGALPGAVAEPPRSPTLSQPAA